MKRVRASISVFLALTITLVLSFVLILLESAREKTMLLKASVVLDAAAHSTLAEYHTLLWEVYDVLYIDASYKTDVPNYEFIKNRLQYYAEQNLKYDQTGWLSLNYIGSQFATVQLATDLEGYDFYQKAIESVDFKTGLMAIEQVATYLNTVQEHMYVADAIAQDKEKIRRQIDEANGTEVIWNGEMVRVEIENPISEKESGNALLRKLLGQQVELSQSGINLSGVVSHRNLAKGNADGLLDKESNYIDGILEKLQYVYYADTHFQNFMHLEQDKPLRYELEYLIAGKATDIQNLESVVSILLLIREADNYFFLMSNEAKKLEAHAIAASIANVATWLEPIVYQAVLLNWAYDMSIEDIQKLFAGEKIPLCKSASELLGNLGVMGYSEYLCLLLLLEDQGKLTMRSLDLIELFIRTEEKTFYADGCVANATLEGRFIDAYRKYYSVTKTMEYY